MTDLPNDPTAPSDQPTGSSTESERERHDDVLDSDPTASDGGAGPLLPPAPTAPLQVPPHPVGPPTAPVPPPSGAETPWQGQSGQQGQFGQQGHSGRAGRPGQFAPPTQQEGQLRPQGQLGGFGPQGAPGQFGQQGNPGQFGPQGNPGQFGQQGNPGQFGPQGNPGQFGQQGNPGQFGPQGNPGQFGQQSFGGGQQQWQGQSGGPPYAGSGGPRPGGAGGPIGPGQGGFKWWWAAIPAAIILILVAVYGIKVIAPQGNDPSPRSRTVTPSRTSSPTKSSTPPRTTTRASPSAPTTAGPPASAVAPSPGQAAVLKDPKKVRFEVLSATRGKANIRFGADNKDTKRLDTQQTPFAVEAPLSPQNNYLSVGGSDYDTKALLMCRIYLDDALAYQDVGSGSVSCSVSRNLVSETRAAPGGAALGAETAVAPLPGDVPALPASPTKTRFEVYSSVEGGTVDLRYGADGKNQTEGKGQKTPLGIEAAVPGGGDYLSYRAGSYNGPVPYLMCRLYLDGVLVNMQQGYRTVSCDTSLSALYPK